MVKPASGQSIFAAEMGGQAAVFQSILLFGAVVLAALLAFVILLYLRRRLRSGDASSGRSLSLDELRSLRDRGKLTDSEYAVLREQAITAMRTGISSETGTNAR